jgi:hypothetical protein
MAYSRTFVAFMFLLAVLCAAVAWAPFIAHWIK